MKDVCKILKRSFQAQEFPQPVTAMTRRNNASSAGQPVSLPFNFSFEKIDSSSFDSRNDIWTIDIIAPESPINARYYEKKIHSLAKIFPHKVNDEACP